MASGGEVIEIREDGGDLGKIEACKSSSLVRNNENLILCKLCLDEIIPGNKFTMELCGCFFCISCMRMYVEVLIKDGIVLLITCPDSECVIQGMLQVHEISLLAQPDTFEKYLRLKYEQEVAIDPRRTFCPVVTCSSICHIPQHENNQVKGKKKKRVATTTRNAPIQVSCPTCEFNFCHICKAEWGSGHECNDPGTELEKLQSRAGLSRTGQLDAVIKRCPVCNVLIERDKGCAQMICKNCSHVFCWYCLKLLDNDFMLRHFDKGPCKNFLGHSRAQVFRHRMGVIGLFIAFSLLLIVASPILLLAAPVFLFCKWKECCERALIRARQENNNALFVETGNQRKGNSVQIVSEVGAREQTSSSSSHNLEAVVTEINSPTTLAIISHQEDVISNSEMVSHSETFPPIEATVTQTSL